ncbi:hypothetical protein AB1Y20_005390 [Prymnesium parvum]|uniref:PPIase cyclophilin-type domain-containing protein n=1 Tax=Prymnesium parvum TaxID=97485 RepID=A0AB34J6D4_PRYPA
MKPICDPFIVLGKANTTGFQKAKAVVAASFVPDLATVKPLFVCDFEHELAALKLSMGGKAYCHSSELGAAAFTTTGEWIGGEDDLFLWLKRKGCISTSVSFDESKWKGLAEEELISLMASTGNKYTFLEFSVDGSVVGKLVLELFPKFAPRTCASFKALCTGEQGKWQDGTALTYKGCPVHRIKKGGWIQSGDIVNQDGSGGISAYGKMIPDESFAISHDRAGILGMCNNGCHTATSQFYITLQSNLSMNQTFVAFGRVIDGLTLLEFLGETETVADRPKADVRISDCGMFSLTSQDQTDKEKAAAKLQAIQRSRLVRAEMKQKQAAAAKVQAAKRGQRARARKKKEAQAATKMQAIQRGKHVRKGRHHEAPVEPVEAQSDPAVEA